MLRRCKDCGLEAHSAEDLELFVKAPKQSYKRRNLCKPCLNERERKVFAERKATHGTTWSDKYLQREYHCTRDEYKERMATSSVCQCCGTTDDLCYDHDHDTMAFRGVLCNRCNRAIGLLGDNIEGLTKALAYLEHHQAQQNAG